MALDPARPLSPAYARRIARALARGKTLQQARGHKAREHVARRERELALGDLTTRQKQEIRKYIKEQASKGGVAALVNLSAKVPEWNDYYKPFRMQGYELLNKMKTFRRENHSRLAKGKSLKTYTTKKGKTRSGIYASIDDMLDDFADYEDIEPWMLFYH